VQPEFVGSTNEEASMCTCKQDTEARLLEALPAELPEGFKGLSARLTGYAMMFGGQRAQFKQVMPIEVTFQVPTKAGVMKDKKRSMSMLANYCMFCGEKYDKDEPAVAAA
jgi:hypothetical protein